MPLLSRCFLRFSLAGLVAGFGLASLLLLHKAVGWPGGWTWRLLPAHLELLWFGFLLQAAFGVAYWTLPRRRGRRGRRCAAWASLLLLNAGIAAVLLAPLLAVPGLRVLGRAAETAAVMAFVVHAWPRIRGLRTSRGA